jgi:hypothetical protein
MQVIFQGTAGFILFLSAAGGRPWFDVAAVEEKNGCTMVPLLAYDELHFNG